MKRTLGGSRRMVGAGAGAAALIGIGYIGTTWARYGKRPRKQQTSLLDGFMPDPEVSEVHETRVAAPADVAYRVAAELDFQSSPLVKAIFRGRELIMGSAPTPREPQSFLSEVRSLGWRVLTEEPGRFVVMGAVTQPWQADVVFRGLSPEEFLAFSEPGYAKIAWTLEVEPAGAMASIVRTETRVKTTDAESRRRFRRYWAFLSPGILLLRREMLRMIRGEAQRRIRARQGW
jgi:hypothetical protein